MPLLLLALAPVAALAQAQEPTVVRLSDAVGDTIDAAERDRFHLFPNTAGFERAVIFAMPGPEFYAEVTRAVGGTMRQVYYPILPGQLVRIRFLIDDSPYVTPRGNSRETGALASFWWDIERRPLRNMTGEPVIAQEAPPAPTEAVTAGEPAPSGPTNDGRPQLWPRTTENRSVYTLHGVTLGSLAGGYLGSRTIKYVGTGQGCLPDFGPGFSYPYYSVNHSVFWTATCGLTALGSSAGYVIGDQLDRKTLPSPTQTYERARWRTCCAAGSGVLGAALGLAFFLYLGSRYYGETENFPHMDNDPIGLTLLPAALTSVCIAVEVTTIGHQIGRAIDRHNAAKADTKRRALGR